MESISSIVSRTIAFLSAVAFAIVMIAVVLTFNVDQLVLQPGIYKSALEKFGIYEILPALMTQEVTDLLDLEQTQSLESLFSQVPPDAQKVQEFSRLAGYLRLLSQPQKESAVQSFFPPDQQKIVVNDLIDQVFSLLDGNTTRIQFSWIMPKSKLVGDDGVNLVFTIMDTQPDCTPEQIISLARAYLEGIDNLLVCNVPQDLRPIIIPQIKTALSDIAQKLPDETVFDIEKTQTSQPGMASSPARILLGNHPSQTIKRIRLGMRFSPILAVILLLFVTLFGVRTLKDLWILWGIPFFLVGLAGLGATLLVSPFSNWVYHMLVGVQPPVFLAPSLFEIGGDIAQYVAGKYVLWLAVEAGMFLALGIAAIILLLILKGKQK